MNLTYKIGNAFKCASMIMAFSIVFLLGCTKPDATNTSAPAAAQMPDANPSPIPAGPSTAAPKVTSEEADQAALLDFLTQTLRKYSAEKQHVPRSLDELVKAGYLQQMPQAPAGKKFLVNDKRVEVTLANQ